MRVISGAALLAAIVVSEQLSKASLLAYEGFNYATGSANLTGLSGGFGWKGAWQGVNNGSSSVQSLGLTAGANSPTGYDSLSTGKSVISPNNTRTGRTLDISTGGSFDAKGFLDGSGNIGASGKTIYLSFTQQPNGTTSYYEFEFHRGNLGDPGRIGGIGNDSGANTSVYLRVPTAGQTAIGAGSTAVNFYVVRIDFLGGNDTVSVYQNPTSATEPITPTLQKTGAGDMSFSGLSFGCFNSGRTVSHDEVRVGETWADVTSPGAYSTGNWDGGGANNNWSAAGNWDNDVVPVFASSLTFGGVARLNNTNDLTNISANAITFDSAAGAFVLDGNTLGLNGNIAFNANPTALITQTINLPLTATGNFTIDTRANGNINVNGNITGANSTLTQTSTGNVGTLTLSGTNQLAGFVINGGTNILTGNTTITGTGGTRIALGNANAAFSGTLIIQPGATLSVAGNFGDAMVIGRDGGSGKLIQNGGTFTFSPGNNGSIFVGATGNTATRAEYVMNGGLLDMSGNRLGVGFGATLITGVVNQVSGVISNVSPLLIPFVSGGGNGLGIYNLNGGIIYIGSGGITTDGNRHEINLGGGTVGAVANWSSTVTMTLTGSNGPVTFNPAGNTITLFGALSGSGGLIVNGAGSLILNGANTYTGDTLVTAGSTLQFDVTGTSFGAIKLVNGATLNLNYSGNRIAAAAYTNGVALAVGTYDQFNLPGFIIGSGTLQVTSGISTGIWDGGGANNFWSTGGNWDQDSVPGFPISLTFGGSLRLTNTNDLPSVTAGSITFSNTAGAFTLSGNDLTLSGAIGFNGNPAAAITQTVNLGLTFNGNQSITLPSNGNLTLNGSIASGFHLTKGGLGTLTLGGASDAFDYLAVTGGTNIITGNVSITGIGNGSKFYIGDIGTIGNLVIQPGASLDVNGFFGDSGVIGRDSGIGTIIQNGGLFNFNMANQGYLFVGASGNATTHAEYFMNGGTLDLNNNTLAVALSANGATLITGLVSQVSGTINNVGKLDLGAFNLGPGRGIYRMTGGSIFIGANGIVSDSGVYEVYLGGGTVGAYASWLSALNMNLTGINGPVTFDTAGNTINLTGILSGAGGFNVIGGGVLELGGANAFTGDMTVNVGTLQLDATGSSPGVLRMVDGTILNLNYGGNYIVGGFTTNGVQVNNGTYNAGNMPGFITGSGNLLVQTVSLGIWDGGGADNNWSTGGNWDHNVLPIFPVGLTFGGSTRLNNNNDLVGATLTSLTFSNSAGAFMLAGNGVNLSGNVGFKANPAAPIVQSVNLPLTMTANVNIDTPANGNVSIGGDISAANNSLFKLGAGTLTLGGSNTVAGLEADGGTTVITGNTTVAGNGSLRTYVANADYLGGSVGTLNIANGANLTISGNFADAYVIGRDGGNGTINQNGGTFNFAIGNNNFIFVAAGNVPTRGTYNMNGGLLDMNGNTLALGLAVGGAMTTGLVNQVSGVITNVGHLYLGFIGGEQGFGNYTLSGGSLYVGSGGITSDSGRYQMNLGGGTVGAVADWSSPLNITLTGINGSATFDSGINTITLSGVLSGAGGLMTSGAGVLELSGANNYTGDTTVKSGATLRLDSTSNNSSTFRASSSATLNLNYIGTITVTNFYTNNVAVSSGTYNASNLPAFITGAGSLHVVGSQTTPPSITFTVSGNNLNLNWGASGFTLQQQTNSLSIGLGTNWVDVPGSASLTSTNIPISHTAPAVFYRLRQ